MITDKDIRKLLIKYNTSSRNNTKIQYLVIHDTGNPGAGAGGYNHYLYFNGGNRNASAHYFVDSKEIVQLVEDSTAAWHCGDGKGKYGITNSNSIGIEICINRDGDYNKAVAKTVELVVFLMKKHNISIDKVVRHYDASRKSCPDTMKKDNWKTWHEFKKEVEKKYKGEKEEKVKVNILGRVTELNGYLKDGTNYVEVTVRNKKEYLPLRDLAESIGLKVDWDNKNRIVLLK